MISFKNAQGQYQQQNQTSTEYTRLKRATILAKTLTTLAVIW